MKAKKVLALALTAAISAASLAGCAGSTTGGSTSATGSGAGDAKATVNIFQFKVEAKDAFQKAVNQYVSEHPNVTINLETVGGGDDYAAALKTKMESDPPTIFNVGGPQDVSDWSSKLQDLSDQPWVQHALKDTLDDVTVSGKIYGMPFDLEGYGFVINRQIFEDAGVSFDSMLTFDGMKKGFDTLKAKIDSGAMKDKYPNLEAVMEYPAKEQWVVGDHDENPILAQDFSSATEAFNAKELPFKAADAYKTMVDFQASYTTNAKTTGTLNSVDYSTCLEGGLAIERVAAIEQGNWVSPSVEATDASVLAKLDMLPYPVPGYSDGKYCTGVPMYWAVNKDANDADKAAAEDFLNWMYQSDEGKQIIINDAKFVPAFDNYDGLEPSDPLGKRLLEASKAGNTMPGWVYNGVPKATAWSEKVVGADVQKYLSGDMTWDALVQDAKDQWKTMRAS